MSPAETGSNQRPRSCWQLEGVSLQRSRHDGCGRTAGQSLGLSFSGYKETKCADQVYFFGGWGWGGGEKQCLKNLNRRPKSTWYSYEDLSIDIFIGSTRLKTIESSLPARTTNLPIFKQALLCSAYCCTALKTQRIWDDSEWLDDQKSFLELPRTPSGS